ncbi:MAG TPA: sulfate transporter CysZ [Gammaproteobacteria bacterium]|nr:sulfate transporter CysZ [Gammaproteobacteria bacterium]
MLEIFRGALYLPRGLALILRPGIRRYVIMPLAINVAVFALLIGIGVAWFGGFVATLQPSLPGWLEWLIWPLWALFVLAVLLVLFFTFSLLANLIAAPFNGLLAEAVERELRGNDALPQTGLWQLLRDTPAILFSQLGKMGYSVAWAVPLLLLFVIPGVNIAAPFLWFAFGSWMLALEYLDYPMGNHGLLFRQQRRRARESRPLVLGFGAATTAMTTIPGLNLLVMPLAVAAATLLWVERFSTPTESSSRTEVPPSAAEHP